MVNIECLARRIIGFVMNRRQESAGFAAAPSLPSSIEDTYFALRILETLQPFSDEDLISLSKDRSIKEYLIKIENRHSSSIKVAFRHLIACRIVGIDPDDAWIRRFISPKAKEGHDLRRDYYRHRILREGLSEPTPQNDRTLIAGYLAKYRTVEELWMVLYLTEGSPQDHLDREVLISWLHACRNPDGGFGYMPGTTSFMENNYYSLRSLRLLRARAPSQEHVLAFILRSQGKGGGFARRSGAAPFLDATWHAVATIALLMPWRKVNNALRVAGATEL
jgi:hypothetical protein